MSFPPVYVGNYEYEADERDLEDLFKKYGDVKSVEYKSGFCFVYFEDKRDAEECIRDLDGREWGRMARRLRVEFAKNDANVRAREADRRSTAEPNNTLFVAGFDPRATRSRDLERAFEGFGTLTRCEVKSTFAFVEFEKLEDAKEAHDDMHHRKLNGREITVEYVLKKSGGGGGGGGGRDREGGRGRRDDRNGRDRDRGGYGGRRDDRDRDRGHGGGRDDRGRRDDRGFGGRGRGGRSRSRSYDRDNRRRRSPSYSRSPPPRRGRSPAPRRSPPKDDRRRSRSPYRSPPRAASPDRSYSPMRGADE